MKFSLVIPLAPGRNAEILDSIKQIDYSKKEFEIIVEEGTNPSDNRNKGAKKSKGEIIVFLDDDAVMDKNLLKEAELFFETHKEIDIVGGAQLTPKWQEGFAKISGYALSSKFGAWKMGRRYSQKEMTLNADETMLTSANLLCRKEVMKKIKFDKSLFPGEDPKFIEDAKRAGFKIAYNPNLILYHKRRETIKALIKQISSYGRMRTKKESFLNTLKKPFFLIPSIFLIYLVMLFIFSGINLTFTGFFIKENISLINPSFNFLLFLPLIFYLYLNVLVSIYESVKNRNLKSIFLLPFIFPIIHLSYGLGMILGYFKKYKS
ncbi:glycosyltransferase [Candidatus Pacearchaeota archaeon]|nr:glycosyltransferase [Candidatus Pacearchaeota archaeon]